MKKLIALTLSAFFCVSLFGMFAFAEEGDEWNAVVAEPDEEWNLEPNEEGDYPGDTDGHTGLYSVDFVDFTYNGSDTVTVNSAFLRYHYFLVLENIDAKTYIVRQIGNNIVWDRDGFQHDITLNDGDLVLSFFYNENNGYIINQAHFDAYLYAADCTAVPPAVYNETVNAIKDLYVYIDGEDVTYSKVPIVPDTVDFSEDESSAEPVSSEEQPAAPSSDAESSAGGETPSTSDSGVILLLLITTLSLAASLIVRRRA